GRRHLAERAVRRPVVGVERGDGAERIGQVGVLELGDVVRRVAAAGAAEVPLGVEVAVVQDRAAVAAGLRDGVLDGVGDVGEVLGLLGRVPPGGGLAGRAAAALLAV